MEQAMKHTGTYMTAGLVGVTFLTLGSLTSAYAADSDGFKKFGTHRGHGHAQVVAEVLGISADELRERVENGEKVREILEAEGISRDDIRAAMQEHIEARLDAAVENGRMTQDEADERLEKMAERHAQHEAARVAIENNDYDAWSAAVDGTPLAEKVDADSFEKLVEAHELREDGDHAGARAIMEELGIEKQGKRGFGKGGQRGERGSGLRGGNR